MPRTEQEQNRDRTGKDRGHNRGQDRRQIEERTRQDKNLGRARVQESAGQGDRQWTELALTSSGCGLL